MVGLALGLALLLALLALAGFLLLGFLLGLDLGFALLLLLLASLFLLLLSLLQGFLLLLPRIFFGLLAGFLFGFGRLLAGLSLALGLPLALFLGFLGGFLLTFLLFHLIALLLQQAAGVVLRLGSLLAQGGLGLGAGCDGWLLHVDCRVYDCRIYTLDVRLLRLDLAVRVVILLLDHRVGHGAVVDHQVGIVGDHGGQLRLGNRVGTVLLLQSLTLDAGLALGLLAGFLGLGTAGSLFLRELLGLGRCNLGGTHALDRLGWLECRLAGSSSCSGNRVVVDSGCGYAVGLLLVVLLLKILEVVGKRAALVDEQVEVVLADEHLVHLAGQLQALVALERAAVLQQLLVVGKTLDHEQAHAAEGHRLQVVVLDFVGLEIVACHLIEQLVAAHRVVVEGQHKELSLAASLSQGLEGGLLASLAGAVVAQLERRPVHAAHVAASRAGELAAGVELLEHARCRGGDVGLGIALEQLLER